MVHGLPQRAQLPHTPSALGRLGLGRWLRSLSLRRRRLRGRPLPWRRRRRVRPLRGGKGICASAALGLLLREDLDAGFVAHLIRL